MGHKPMSAKYGLTAKCVCTLAVMLMCMAVKAADARYMHATPLAKYIKPATVASLVPVNDTIDDTPINNNGEKPIAGNDTTDNSRKRSLENELEQNNRNGYKAQLDSIKAARQARDEARQQHLREEREKRDAKIMDQRQRIQTRDSLRAQNKLSGKSKGRSVEFGVAGDADSEDKEEKSKERSSASMRKIPLPEDTALATIRAEYNNERKYKYRLLRQQAKAYDMPSRTFKRWMRYYTGPGSTTGNAYLNARNEADTVDVYRKTMMFDADTLRIMAHSDSLMQLWNDETLRLRANDTIDGKEMRYLVARLQDIRARSEHANLLLRKQMSYNAAAELVVGTYAHLSNVIDSLSDIALDYDMQYLERKYPNKLTVNRAYKRAEQRKKRIWKALDNRVLSGEGLDEDNKFQMADMKKLWKKDSVMLMWADSLKAKTFLHRFSFHTNALGWLLAVPNLGIEFDLSGKPSNRFSVIARGYFKPNMNHYRANPSFNYNVLSGNLELRKYWRFGQIKDVPKYRTWDYGTKYKRIHPRERKAVFADEVDPLSGERMIEKDSIKVEDAEYRTNCYLGDALHHYVEYTGQKDIYGLDSLSLKRREFITVNKGDGDAAPDTTIRYDKNITIWTADYLHRIWEPLRYNVLSHRFVGEEKGARTDIRYYLGAMVGYEKYHWVLGNKGRQGKSAYGCLTAGLVMPLRLGTRLDVDFGAAVGVEMARFYKFRYNSESRCYAFTSERRRHVTPYPVVKEVHVALVYSLTPSGNKTHNLFLTEEFLQKTNRLHWDNEVAKEVAKTNKEKKYRQKAQREYFRWERYRQERKQREAVDEHIKVLKMMKENASLSYEEALARYKKDKNEKESIGIHRDNLNYQLPDGIGKIADVTDDDL